MSGEFLPELAPVVLSADLLNKERLSGRDAIMTELKPSHKRYFTIFAIIFEFNNSIKTKQIWNNR
jgi:hypothetical protein